MAKFWKENRTPDNEEEYSYWMYNIEVCGRTFGYTAIEYIHEHRNNLAERRFEMPWSRSGNSFSIIGISPKASWYARRFSFFTALYIYFSERYFVIRYRNQIISALDEGYKYFHKEQ